MADFDLSNLTAEELATLRTNTLAAINGILTSAQSYSMHGRSFTKADLPTLYQSLSDISDAQAVVAGTTRPAGGFVYASVEV